MAKRKTAAYDYRSPRTRASHARRVGGREMLQSFLIVCEGQETEKNYFEAFKVPRDVRAIEIKGLGTNTLSLVRETLRIKEALETQNGIAFDQIWCVFDRDSFEAQHFNEAIRLAESAGLRVAYSNEAFEIWYLLHFDYHTAALSRHDYGSRLSKLLGKPYRKNDPQIYNVLRERQDAALKNARRLITRYKPHHPERDNPSTTVHLLVEELNRHLPDARRN